VTQGGAEAEQDEEIGKMPTAAGERWGCFTIDRTSRFIVAWASGARDAALAQAVVRSTRARTAGRAGIGWISDGWVEYEEAIRRVYYDPVPTPDLPWELLLPTPGVALTQAVKHRKGRRLERVEVRAVLGEPAERPYTVLVERQNGVLRDRLAGLTRKTHAFAKRAATWDACFSLALFEHNWVLPHQALRQRLAEPVEGRRYDRRTPAMALGLTDHRWSLVEFLTHPAYHGM
jgi:IS1 family transposase